MENIAILLDLVLRAAAQMQQYASLISKARAEGRDVTREELDSLYAKDDAARAELQALIDQRSHSG